MTLYRRLPVFDAATAVDWTHRQGIRGDFEGRSNGAATVRLWRRKAGGVGLNGMMRSHRGFHILYCVSLSRSVPGQVAG